MYLFTHSISLFIYVNSLPLSTVDNSNLPAWALHWLSTDFPPTHSLVIFLVRMRSVNSTRRLWVQLTQASRTWNKTASPTWRQLLLQSAQSLWPSMLGTCRSSSTTAVSMTRKPAAVFHLIMVFLRLAMALQTMAQTTGSWRTGMHRHSESIQVAGLGLRFGLGLEYGYG